MRAACIAAELDTISPMKLTLHIWRQANRTAAGKMMTYSVDDVSPDMSFLEMLDQLNEKLVKEGQEPVAFDHDCREGICGSCAMMIDGQAHGPERATAVCQLHMRSFADGRTSRSSRGGRGPSRW